MGIHLEEFSIGQQEIRQLPILSRVSVNCCNFAYDPLGKGALLHFQKQHIMQEGGGIVILIQNVNNY